MASSSNRRGNAKTTRSWTTTKGIALCKSWCEAMENYNVGDKRTGFWEVVFDNFKKEIGETIRKYDTVNLDRDEEETRVTSLPLDEPLKTFGLQTLHLSSVSDKRIATILEAAREKFRFGDKWRGWIQECLRSARTSVLLNGSPTLEFFIKRGLRQGDPLLPFLFVLIMEGFRVTIRDATQANLIKGVSAIHGDGVGLSHFAYKSKELCAKTIGSINHLNSNGIIPTNTLRFKVGCKSQWRRIINSRLCFDMLKALLTELESVLISIGNDEVRWGLNHDASFSVGVTRNHIDDVILLTLPVVTSWCKILPRKVNIFIWRLRLDRLPHRFNLSRRGLDIQAIVCPDCSKGMEYNDHIFFSCDVALDIWRLVRIWLDVNIPLLNSHSD
nr:RNA-directed DNA polymerase, eukaryota [Tanacetum cinerariifolium]